MRAAPSPIEVYPATVERWSDLEALFGPNGASAGCWCMFWRLTRADYKKLQGEGNKAVLHDRVCQNQVPGLLAYLDGKPVGWCSIGPREDYAALENSRILKRIDDSPVWSIVCFYIAKKYRNKGIMAALLQGAVRYAASRGAQMIEGYPLDLQSHLLAGQTLTRFSGYMGIASVFKAAGFEQVAAASETQLIMRYHVKRDVVRLRDVIDSDLEVFFENERDPQAVAMAAFTAKEPDNREKFDAHWARIRANPSVRIQTVLVGEQVAGSVLSYEDEGHPEVSYWIGREYWGKGVATQALQAFLQAQTARPFYARAAKDNLASIHVLEKCGFKLIEEMKGFANARGEEIEEVLMKLD